MYHIGSSNLTEELADWLAINPYLMGAFAGAYFAVVLRYNPTPRSGCLKLAIFGMN